VGLQLEKTLLQGGHKPPLADNLGTTLSHNMYTHDSLQAVCETFSEKGGGSHNWPEDHQAGDHWN